MPTGIYKRTEEHKRKISKALMGVKKSEESKLKALEANNGNRHTKESNRKRSEAMKGAKSSAWKGGEVKTKCYVCGKEGFEQPCRIKTGRGRFCSQRCSGIWKIKHTRKHDTNIERLIEDELIRRSIPYTKQVPLLGVALVDFLLVNDIVIQCDGGYWHNRQGAKERDSNQDFMLKFHGYKVFRFWEKDIKKSAKKCIDKIARVEVKK